MKPHTVLVQGRECHTDWRAQSKCSKPSYSEVRFRIGIKECIKLLLAVTRIKF